MVPAQAGNIRGELSGYPMLQGLRVEHHPGNWLMNLLPPSHLENPRHPQSTLLVPHEAVKSTGEGNCKLFGIPLFRNSQVSKPYLSHASAMCEPNQHPVMYQQSFGTISFPSFFSHVFFFGNSDSCWTGDN